MKYTLIASLLSAAVYAAPTQKGAATAAPAKGAAPATPATPATAQTQPQTANTNAAAGALTPAQAAKIAAGNGITAANSPQAVASLTTLQSVKNAAPGSATAGKTPTSIDLATAVINWQADTSMVSMFLDVGKSITDETAFKQAAAVAYNAEVDELNHKAVIDAANSAMPQVISANSTLATGGAFQQVVDLLLEMSQLGTKANGDIDLIVQNRCVNVLPNIDAYMASTGSAIQSVRPKACDLTGVAGGVQSQGATLPGQAPGSPAAAIAAAAALAAGSGNGIVNNAAFPVAGASTAASAATGKAPATAATGKAPAAASSAAAKAPATAAAPGAAKAPAAKAPKAN